MPELIYINPLSAAKVAAAISIVLGLLVSVIMGFLGLFSVLSSLIFPVSTIEAGADLLTTIIRIFLTTIAVTIIGSFTGGIGALIYNIVAGIFGGLDLGFADMILVTAEEDENEGSIGYE